MAAFVRQSEAGEAAGDVFRMAEMERLFDTSKKGRQWTEKEHTSRVGNGETMDCRLSRS